MGSIPGKKATPDPAPGVHLPTITLDTTLADLYKRANPGTARERIGYIFCGVNAALDLTPSFPRNSKYLYQDTPFNTLPPSRLVLTTSATLQRSLASKYLSLIPQRDAFIAGSKESSAVICFPADANDLEHSRREAEATLSVLHPAQKPELVFCPGPKDIPPLEKIGVHKVAYKIALDGLEGLPLTVPLDTTWFLNSKAALARSGLPTPKVNVVEVNGLCEGKGDCCEVCVTDKDGVHFVPVGCTGRRGRWIAEETKRILAAVEVRKPPFVLKNQQTFGGAGTWVVSSEEDKKDLLNILSGPNGVLRKMLSRVTEKNHHLRPAAIIISDIVKDPIEDYGLTFFVTNTGDAIFLGASEQMCDDNNAWIGSTINYSRQDKLRKKFDSLVKRTAKWLSEQGYYGPAGIDVLETKKVGATESHNGEQTAHHIVDMNVRTSGSMCLPLLRGHFTSRGLTCASSFGITVKSSREEFIRQSRKDFESGRMCILSWYQDKQTGMSIADVAIGAEDDARLQEGMKKVREMTEEVVF
jgi:hypothetical protein